MPTPDGEKLKRNGPNDVLRRHVHPTSHLAFGDPSQAPLMAHKCMHRDHHPDTLSQRFGR
jgi:hypothetical protein